ncbi:MAG: response regulator [Lachnospiraceae bacterium]|nr:response regulator [Lachnospiraceae bacterium]
MYITKIVFFAVVAVGVSGLLYFFGMDRSGPIKADPPVYIDEWTVIDPDGSVFTSGREYHNADSKKGTFTMVSVLPANIHDDSLFCVIAGGDIAVYINGELRNDFYEDRDIPYPGGCVKRFYFLTPVYPSDSGAEIRMERIGTTRRGFIYQDTFVAGSFGLDRYLMREYGLEFMLSEIVMIFSLVIVIISIVMRLFYKHRIEVLYGAMSILVLSGWLITNSYLFPFIYGHYHVDGVMNYMLCLMIPFNLVFYLDALQHGRYRRVMNGVQMLGLANLIVWPVLHFTGVYSFPNALLYMDAIMGIQVVIVMVVLAVDSVRGYAGEYKYTALGFVGLLICGLLEIVTLNFLPVVNGNVLMLAGLTILLAMAVIQQVVDLKKLSDERQRAVDLSEAKTRFLASMSHEIRTPINSVLGMNEMILRENRDPVIAEYAESVRSSGRMLLMLVNDVLDFSKIEAGKMEINKAEYRLAALLKDIMPMLTERAGGKGLELNTLLAGDVPDGQCSDEFRIKQILINLINNAIKYTDKGTVTLTVGGEYMGSDDYLLRLSIRDTGRGIREEDQKHLFEAFTRADIRKNSNIEGTGLGLAIVKSIVDSMDGSITVESTYGEGSEFTVTLPVEVTDRTPLGADFMETSGRQASDRDECDYSAPDADVLAVDDNNTNLKIVRFYLKRSGIVPDTCDSGVKAVEMCRTRHYDVILLDHMMPEMDGIETLKAIRDDERSMNRETPALVLTANALAGSRQIYIDAGFADYLTKPLDCSVLEQAVKRYLPPDKILPADNKVDHN